jgi:cold shock CspA family protein
MKVGPAAHGQTGPRVHGTLARWNDERGFGFISPAAAGDEVFVHISAFPRGGSRPQVGELLSYVLGVGPNGQARAQSIVRAVARAGTRRRTSRRHPSATVGGRGISLIAVLAVIGVAAWLWSNPLPLQPQPAMIEHEGQAPVMRRATVRFSCDGRTHCSQMTSCAEAEYFIAHCPNTAMDGDGDGEPCEAQWCN